MSLHVFPADFFHRATELPSLREENQLELMDSGLLGSIESFVWPSSLAEPQLNAVKRVWFEQVCRSMLQPRC